VFLNLAILLEAKVAEDKSAIGARRKPPSLLNPMTAFVACESAMNVVDDEVSWSKTTTGPDAEVVTTCQLSMMDWAGGRCESAITIVSLPLHVIMPVVVTSRVIGQLPVAVSCVTISKKMRSPVG